MTVKAQHLDDLLAYLPRLEKRQSLIDSNQKIKDADDCPAVCSFFETFHNSPLYDYNYKPKEAQQIMGNVDNADLADIRQALTYCFRHQRWTGSWAYVIDRRKGYTNVVDLLKRLQKIREAM